MFGKEKNGLGGSTLARTRHSTATQQRSSSRTPRGGGGAGAGVVVAPLSLSMLSLSHPLSLIPSLFIPQNPIQSHLSSKVRAQHLVDDVDDGAPRHDVLCDDVGGGRAHGRAARRVKHGQPRGRRVRRRGRPRRRHAAPLQQRREGLAVGQGVAEGGRRGDDVEGEEADELRAVEGGEEGVWGDAELCGERRKGL